MTITCLPEMSAQDQWDQIARTFSANVLGGAPIIPETNEWYTVANDFLAQKTLVSLMQSEFRERDPRYACCDNLVNMAAYDKVYPRPARAAQGYVTVSGAAGAAVPANLQFSLGGQSFTTSVGSQLPATVPGAAQTTGFFTVRVSADVAGGAGNVILPATAIAELQTATPGLTRNVVLDGSRTCGGLEAETCEEFRRRYLGRVAYRPHLALELVSGWIIDDWPCATRVCLRTCCGEDEPDGADACGASPLRLYVMFERTWAGGAAPASVIADLNSWLWGDTPGIGEGRAPIGMCGVVVPYTLAAVSLEIVGVACLNSDVQNEIRRRVVEYFDGLCPGVSVCVKDVVAIATQVAGRACNLDATFFTAADNVEIDECGSVQPECDVRLTLSSLTFP